MSCFEWQPDLFTREINAVEDWLKRLEIHRFKVYQHFKSRVCSTDITQQPCAAFFSMMKFSHSFHLAKLLRQLIAQAENHNHMWFTAFPSFSEKIFFFLFWSGKCNFREHIKIFGLINDLRRQFEYLNSSRLEIEAITNSRRAQLTFLPKKLFTHWNVYDIFLSLSVEQEREVWKVNWWLMVCVWSTC